MKLHTDTLGAMHVINAAHKAGQSLGCSLYVETLQVGSRSHRYAYEVHMTGDGTTCRNRTNPRSAYGPDRSFSAGYAGWGWLMAELYDVDAAAVWGSVKNPAYASKQDFHAKTAWLFDTDLDLAARRATTLDFQVNGPHKMQERHQTVRAMAPMINRGRDTVLATCGTDYPGRVVYRER